MSTAAGKGRASSVKKSKARKSKKKSSSKEKKVSLHQGKSKLVNRAYSKPPGKKKGGKKKPRKPNPETEARANAALNDILKKANGTGFLPKRTQDQEVLEILEDVLG